MTTYKFHYFNLRGRGELSRMLFHLAGVEFEDVRYAITQFGQEGVDFEPLKTSGKLPFGQVPCLEIVRSGHSTFVAQSHSIERYLAGLFGFLGSSLEDGATIDSLCEGMTDVVLAYYPANRKKGEDKGVALNEFYTVTWTKWLALFNNFATHNHEHGNEGHFVGSGLSLADVAFFSLLESMENPQVVNDHVNQFPHLAAIRENVRTHLGTYIESRPKAPF